MQGGGGVAAQNYDKTLLLWFPLQIKQKTSPEEFEPELVAAVAVTRTRKKREQEWQKGTLRSRARACMAEGRRCEG